MRLKEMLVVKGLDTELGGRSTQRLSDDGRRGCKESETRVRSWGANVFLSFDGQHNDSEPERLPGCKHGGHRMTRKSTSCTHAHGQGARVPLSLCGSDSNVCRGEKRNKARASRVVPRERIPNNNALFPTWRAADAQAPREVYISRESGSDLIANASV